jgi:hypothetical protein
MPRKATPGNILEIDLRDGTRTFARELKHPFVAIYDGRALPDADPSRIVTLPVLFVLAVHDSAFREWKKVGFEPLAEGEIEIPDQFIQDIADPSKCRIVDARGVERKATVDECDGLEAAAVWDLEHIVERISAHYKGEPSEFAESLKLERPKQ